MSTCSERLGHKHKHPNGDGRQMEEERRGEKRGEERGFYISFSPIVQLEEASFVEKNINSKLLMKWGQCLLCLMIAVTKEEDTMCAVNKSDITNLLNKHTAPLFNTLNSLHSQTVLQTLIQQ